MEAQQQELQQELLDAESKAPTISVACK